MNISGLQYSKSIKGLRQPSFIRDQEFKLVFTYPILIDKSLQQYTNLIRDFVATSALKEIFVSNAINMVSIASQIYPLTDERGIEHDVMQASGNVEIGSNVYDSPYSFSGKIKSQSTMNQEILKDNVKRKIKQKAAAIKKLLSNDPEYKKLRPYIEMITMDNFIDVPVIVGTKSYPVGSIPILFLLLIASINENKYTLGGTQAKQSVKEIFSMMKDIDIDKGNKLVNRIIQVPPKEKPRFIQWFVNLKQSISKRIGKSIINKFIRSSSKRYTKISNKYDITNDIFEDDETLLILKSVSNEIEDTELFFYFCLDERIANAIHGQSRVEQQIDFTTNKLSMPIKNTFNNMHSRFIKTLSIYGNPAISSWSNLFYPMNIDLDQGKVLDRANSKLNDNISNYIETILIRSIEAELGKGFQLADDKMKLLKGMCTDDFSDSDKITSTLYNHLSNSIISSNGYSFNEANSFLTSISEISKTANEMTDRIRLLMAQIVESDIHSETIMNFFKEYLVDIYKSYSQYYGGINGIGNVPIAHVSHQGSYNAFGINDRREVDEFMNDLLFHVASYLTYLFMYQLQVAMCTLVQEIEIHIETAKNDVLDFPNYTLVIPVETIVGIANAIGSKGWKNYLSREETTQFISSVNDNYTKGIIKFLTKKLDIPNMIVIDDKRKEIYYKMMYNSRILKTKINTIETFIKTISSGSLNINNSNQYY
jgi:hypothetical protein